MRLSVIDILKRLPKTNCKACGEPTCMAYATKLMKKDTTIEACPPLLTPEYADARKYFEQMLAGKAA